MQKKPVEPENLDDYLSEFRQKIATQKQEMLEERRQDLQHVKKGFIGTLAGIFLAGLISWILLAPRFSDPALNEIPVIRRPATPVKIQPNDPGGMEILNQDKSIYNLVEKKEVEPAKVESLLPQPEEPKMPTIVPSEETTETPASAETDTVLEEKTMDELIEEVQTNSDEKIIIPTKDPDLKVTAKTVEPNAKKADSKPQKIQKEEPVSKAASSTASASDGLIWQIQLMASSNKDAMEKSWQSLCKKHSSLNVLDHELESVKTDSGATVYRLKAGRFTSKEDADKFCQKIKTEGSGCLVKKK